MDILNNLAVAWIKIVKLHQSTPKTLFVRSTATNFLESSARICAPRKIVPTSSLFLKTEARIPKPSSTGSVTEP